MNSVPAPAAARAPATSPAGSIMRVNPTGDMSRGMETSVPSTVVRRSGPGTPVVTPMRGLKPTASTAAVLSRMVCSEPAPPSM